MQKYGALINHHIKSSGLHYPSIEILGLVSAVIVPHGDKICGMWSSSSRVLISHRILTAYLTFWEIFLVVPFCLLTGKMASSKKFLGLCGARLRAAMIVLIVAPSYVLLGYAMGVTGGISTLESYVHVISTAPPSAKIIANDLCSNFLS
jgi:hypothetical protein